MTKFCASWNLGIRYAISGDVVVAIFSIITKIRNYWSGDCCYNYNHDRHPDHRPNEITYHTITSERPQAAYGLNGRKYPGQDEGRVERHPDADQRGVQRHDHHQGRYNPHDPADSII